MNLEIIQTKCYRYSEGVVIFLNNGALEKILTQISQKNGDELDAILKAVVLRYSELLPEYETVCLFLPKQDPAERQRILSQVEEICFPAGNSVRSFF